jgi:hypothetical protein
MDPSPAIFVIDIQDANKDEKSKRSHNTEGIKVFLTIFAW